MPTRRRLIDHARAPRRHWRVLYLMCLSLVVVLLAIPIAARPRTWSWLFQNGAQAPPPTDRGAPPVRARITVAGIDRIRDRTPGITADKGPAFDELVDAAARNEVQGSKDVSLDDLLAHPDDYRGRAIALTGTIRRLQRCTNRLVADPGGPLFEAWLFTDESGVRPYRIVVQDIPAESPVGLRIEIPASVTGYFFKLTSYESPAGESVAPLLVARRFESSAK
jgi:hypothetical protein